MMPVAEVLHQLAVWINSKQHFFHTRYGDGELISAFENNHPGVNCDGHRYFPEMGKAMKETIAEVCRASTMMRARVLVGSNNETHPDAPWTRNFLSFLQQQEIATKRVQWASADFWWSPTELQGGKEIITLLQSLKNGFGYKVKLVCKESIRNARWCIDADWIGIPEKDAWLEYARIYQECIDAAEPGTVFVWAAGMPAKVLSWNIFKNTNRTSHIDVGHIFDGPFGIKSRTWLERPEQKEGRAHWEFCRDVFNPYVLEHIPQ